MKRYVGGGGPVWSGAFSTETVHTATTKAKATTKTTTTEDTADSAPGERQDPSRLGRRLGRRDLRAVPEARRAMRELLAHWGRPGRSDTAELLTSELVTNALVHTDQDAQLTATLGPYGLRVEVRDFDPRRPTLRLPDADDGTHGRGLVLVRSLADAWGVRTHAVGKAVWFELDGGAA